MTTPLVPKAGSGLPDAACASAADIRQIASTMKRRRNDVSRCIESPQICAVCARIVRINGQVDIRPGYQTFPGPVYDARINRLSIATEGNLKRRCRDVKWSPGLPWQLRRGNSAARHSPSTWRSSTAHAEIRGAIATIVGTADLQHPHVLGYVRPQCTPQTRSTCLIDPSCPCS